MNKERNKTEYITGATITRVIRTLKNEGLEVKIKLLKGKSVVPMRNEAVPVSTWSSILKDNFTIEVSCEAADGKYAFVFVDGLDFAAVSCSNKENELPYLDICYMDQYLSTMRPAMKETGMTCINQAVFVH